MSVSVVGKLTSYSNISFGVLSAANLPNEATFSGSKGSLTIHYPFYAATSFTSPAGTKEYPLPEPYMPMNFPNSTGMRYALGQVLTALLLKIS